MVLLDTCALLWWSFEPASLSVKAAEVCGQIERDGGAVSSISIWEIGVKAKNRKLDLGVSLESYVKQLRKIFNLSILPVDEEIWLKNLSLNWRHRDPVDRTIVATALVHDWAILTKDRIIAEFYKKTIW